MICALIAAYNEARHVGAVVAATLSHVDHVVVVDDGSSDGTDKEAAAAGATVLRQESNRGKGSALRLGLAHVLAGPYTHVLFLDGDGQHDPAEIPKLTGRIAHGGGDFVLAERELNPDAMPPARYYSNVIGSWILSRFIGAEVSDSQSGFRLIRSDLLRRARLTGSKYEIETEMLIKLVRAGARVERVTVRRLQYAGAQSKMRPFRDTFRTCMLAVRYRYLEG
jgi:UDP-N-acetylglucosamine---dolichyl-phosphate N-acetylglucosaminyltransferase